MAERGWDATGLLRPLWQTFPGKREGLAEAVGTAPETLSSINTGKRRLGKALGGRLANVLGVSLLELGAPTRQPADPAGETLRERLDTLEKRVAVVEAQLGLLAHEVERIAALLSATTARRSDAESSTSDEHTAVE